MTTITISSPQEDFEEDAVAVASTEFVEIFRFVNAMTKLRITLTVGAGGALGGLKITEAAIAGGAHKSIGADAELNTTNVLRPHIEPENAYQSAANGTIQIHLDGGAAEFGIWAKKASTNTTLAIEGFAGERV